jgi:hypothetical protein
MVANLKLNGLPAGYPRPYAYLGWWSQVPPTDDPAWIHEYRREVETSLGNFFHFFSACTHTFTERAVRVASGNIMQLVSEAVAKEFDSCAEFVSFPPGGMKKLHHDLRAIGIKLSSTSTKVSFFFLDRLPLRVCVFV